ncbi:MAG: nucleotidyltransferase family protein [Planctomycetota bacterium]|jgi:molybdenum cofactor cytidylyltransferase
MICAVVLAAGLSRRMGVQKLLLPFGGKTVIAHIVDQILASAVDEVYVVVGHQARRVRRELYDRHVSIVNNPDYESGMLSSVRCGLRALPRRCRTVLVALGDQPSITSKLVDEMLQSFTSAEKSILVPFHDGRRGHPVLFSESYRDQILTHYDNVGLRGLLHAHPDEVFELAVSTSAVLSDMDCPEDYRRELALIEKKKGREED